MMTIKELFDLNGKTAIVTGGAQGIGQAIAFRLAEAGASVMISDIKLETAEDTAKEIEKKGGKARAIAADAASIPDAGRVVQATLDAFGSIDILVNNAGIYPHFRMMEASEDMWNKVIDVNLKGVFFYAQAAAREMKKANNGGRIINIASIAALQPGGNAFYDVSKAGVVALTKSLALSLARYRVTVNAVAPGFIATEGTVEAKIDASSEAIRSRIPINRGGIPDDIAKVVLCLASEATDYMTGSLVLVDGGYMLNP